MVKIDRNNEDWSRDYGMLVFTTRSYLVKSYQNFLPCSPVYNMNPWVIKHCHCPPYIQKEGATLSIPAGFCCGMLVVILRLWVRRGQNTWPIDCYCIHCGKTNVFGKCGNKFEKLVCTDQAQFDIFPRTYCVPISSVIIFLNRIFNQVTPLPFLHLRRHLVETNSNLLLHDEKALSLHSWSFHKWLSNYGWWVQTTCLGYSGSFSCACLVLIINIICSSFSCN